MKEIKFKAWIPALEIELDDVTLYGNGQMGYGSEEFSKALPEKHWVDYDRETVIKDFINEDGDEDFERVMSISCGEDWIWIDDFKAFELTGLKDKHGKEIYGDFHVFSFKFIEKLHKDVELIGVMRWNDDELRYEIEVFSKNHPEYVCLSYISNGIMHDFEIIGNVYSNPELILMK